MKIYRLRSTQFLPISIQQAWEYFSTPRNLGEITPKEMKFTILSVSGSEKMYAGQLIQYKIKVPPGVRMNWLTEITHVDEPYYFVDEQRTGPYRMWHHQHHFKEVEGGVEMNDEVTYALPMGIFGRLVHAFFVKKQLNNIFNYRFSILEDRFINKAQNGVVN